MPRTFRIALYADDFARFSFTAPRPPAIAARGTPSVQEPRKHPLRNYPCMLPPSWRAFASVEAG